MEEKKTKSSGLTTILIIILLLACIGMGGFIFINKDKLTAKENINTTVSNEKKQTNEKTEKCDTVSYDINTTEYGLSDSAVGFIVNIDSSRKNATIRCNGATVSNSFSLGWVTAADTTKYEDLGTKTFNKKVTQVLIDGAGQSASSTAILYLMEDGTVEYTPILKDINTTWSQPDNTKKANSYGALSGITDIISLIPADGSGYHTVLARKADGTIIDLKDALNATGNF